MEKILVQLVGAVMEVGNHLKCILAVLIFLSCYSSKDLVNYYVSNAVEKAKKCNFMCEIEL